MDWFNYVVAKSSGFHSRRDARAHGHEARTKYLAVVDVVKIKLEVHGNRDKESP
jgi:hypothetical protein